MKRVLLSWSSGKDSAWALHVLRNQGEYEIVGLLTTFNQAADRVAMHAVPPRTGRDTSRGNRFASMECPIALALFK